ncbi:MAG: type IV pilus assembly protein PilE [Halioglobus sp.]|jgi:type IV pilus assembly protein PilE
MSTRRGASSIKQYRNRGFTLMELMVVIVIVAVLAGIALPSYQNSVRKGQRSDAKVGLLDVAGRMEQYILDRGTYTYDMSNLGYAADPMVTAEGHFSIDAAACTGGDATTCYVLTATPLASSPLADDDQCTGFSLDFSGAKSATGHLASQCWR